MIVITSVAKHTFVHDDHGRLSLADMSLWVCWHGNPGQLWCAAAEASGTLPFPSAENTASVRQHCDYGPVTFSFCQLKTLQA